MSNQVNDALVQSLGWEHERVQVVQDPDIGLQAVIAIHSTVLGPSLGGLRIRRYEQGLPEALDDALRLSRAMTLKASAAGLDLGGGKAVVVDDGHDELRPLRLAAVAQEIERLGGAYITAEDIGTTTADMDLIAQHTEHVVGGSERDGLGGDPSPDTARTVLGAIYAALDALDPDRDAGDAGTEDRRRLDGRTIGVVGLGKVGGPLSRWLVDAGARVFGFDRVREVGEAARAAGIAVVDSAEELYALELDVLAPCAIGGTIDEELAGALRCRVVCGAANNPLSGEPAAAVLARRGILYVPDFLANCGGLIHVDGERHRDPGRARLAVAEAQTRTYAVLVEARAGGRLPSAVAEEHARTRIDRAREVVR